jgi:hypothetical protein
VYRDAHPVARRAAHNQDIDAGGVLAGFTGVLVRDGYAGYDHMDTATHAECGAHLLRALEGVHDGDPAGQVWAEYMANTLLIAKQIMHQAATAGHTRLSQEQASFIRSEYAGAISASRQANTGQPGSKAAKLVERFARDAADILRFTTDTAIWFQQQPERERPATHQAPTEDQRNLADATRLGRLRRPALLPVHRHQTRHGPPRRTPTTPHHRPMASTRPSRYLKLNTYGGSRLSRGPKFGSKTTIRRGIARSQIAGWAGAAAATRRPAVPLPYLSPESGQGPPPRDAVDPMFPTSDPRLSLAAWSVGVFSG